MGRGRKERTLKKVIFKWEDGQVTGFDPILLDNPENKEYLDSLEDVDPRHLPAWAKEDK